MKHKLFLMLAVMFVLMVFQAFPGLAHPGRTDSSGCHTCRTNCPSWGLAYDQYHCHGGSSSSSSSSSSSGSSSTISRSSDLDLTGVGIVFKAGSSFVIPGLGQLFNGEPWKALLFSVGTFSFYITGANTYDPKLKGLYYLGGVILHLWSIIDAGANHGN